MQQRIINKVRSVICPLETCNRAQTYRVELSSQEGSSAVLRFAPVAWVVLEKVSLCIESGTDELLLVDITLSSVHNRHVSQAQGNHTTSEDVNDVCALVHQVHLGQDAHGPRSLRINLASQLQPV